MEEKDTVLENTDNNENSVENDNINTTEEAAKTAQKTPEKKSEDKKAASAVFECIETVAFAFCTVVLLFTFVFKVVTVDGHSMETTLHDGERLVITSLFYEPKVGDIVVISRGESYIRASDGKFVTEQKPLIKRVIALGGDTVNIDSENWTITVTKPSGEMVTFKDEEYVNFVKGREMGLGYINYPFVVPENEIFALGDNRTASSDSRYYGSFKSSDVLGKAVFRLSPLDRLGLLY